MGIIVECGYCGKAASVASGKILYGANHKLASKYFYYCKPCQAWVGMHEKTKKPFGTLAKATLRKNRAQAHQCFDPIWMKLATEYKLNKKVARQRGYMWLSNELNINFNECHIAMFDIETCKKVIRLCVPIKDVSFLFTGV